MMEKSEKGISPQTQSPAPSEHEGVTYVVDGEEEHHGNGQLKRNLSRRLIHVTLTKLFNDEAIADKPRAADYISRVTNWQRPIHRNRQGIAKWYVLILTNLRIVLMLLVRRSGKSRSRIWNGLQYVPFSHIRHLVY